jgi:hypothetical protein
MFCQGGLTAALRHVEVSAMKTHTFTLLVATALASGYAFAQATTPQMPGPMLPQQSPTRTSNSATQSTGTILRKGIRWESKIPLNKTYAQLTPEQKEILHSMYQNIAPGDEPPFPEKGIKPIFNAVSNAQHILQARGELNMNVTVGPDGKAVQVEDFSDVRSAQMREALQNALMLMKYKPAICNGAPCTMQFKFAQSLKPG